MTTIVSLDVEANGLMGRGFCIGVSVWQGGEEVDFFQGRRPLLDSDGPVDPWVRDNVLPAIEHIPAAIRSYTGLLQVWNGICQTYRDESETVRVLTHIPWPVEARFLLDAHPEPFTGPYPLLDVTGHLDQAGYDPTSVDAYLKARGIPLPEGSPHHPLFDSRSAALAFHDLKGLLK